MIINGLYQDNYLKALDWIYSSQRSKGGSAAYFSPLYGWSKAYPETTGYIIPTLIDASNITGDSKYKELGYKFGIWLLSIQNSQGFWRQGIYPYSNSAKPSIFNTGQILIGLLKLYEIFKEDQWIIAAEKALIWLSKDLSEDKLWAPGDYLNKLETPSYYSHVLWPMLAVSKYINNLKITNLCRSCVFTIIKRKEKNGIFKSWGFSNNKPSFTHNIGYLIKGIQESGRVLENQEIIESVSSTLEKLLRISELNYGKLPGLIDDNFKGVGNFVCLTGNLQIAETLLIYESSHDDLRIVNCSAKLIDLVCSRQSLKSPFLGIKGGIPGSSPFYGKYMSFRYPNWACKFLCDSIVKISERVNKIEN